MFACAIVDACRRIKYSERKMFQASPEADIVNLLRAAFRAKEPALRYDVTLAIWYRSTDLDWENRCEPRKKSFVDSIVEALDESTNFMYGYPGQAMLHARELKGKMSRKQWYTFQHSVRWQAWGGMREDKQGYGNDIGSF